jgi:hypothetical protein
MSFYKTNNYAKTPTLPISSYAYGLQIHAQTNIQPKCSLPAAYNLIVSVPKFFLAGV